MHIYMFYVLWQGDVLFLSPPWGGPTYSKVESYKLDMLLPRDG